MEAIGVPWFIVVRYLGPPLFLLVAGGALLIWRRPRRTGLAWAALVVNLAAAALPFLWIGLQILTQQAEQTVFGLVITLAQPALVVLAWSLLLWALVAPGTGAGTAGGSDGKEAASRARENVG